MAETTINVGSIVLDKLIELGADGLCIEGCGCDRDDLAPCGELGMLCRPAWKYPCARCGAVIYWSKRAEDNDNHVCSDCREAEYVY